MIDPRMPGDGERVHVSARKLVVLEQILRIPHVPPNIRVVHIATVQCEDELKAYKYQREHSEKGGSGAKPSPWARAKINWVDGNPILRRAG